MQDFAARGVWREPKLSIQQTLEELQRLRAGVHLLAAPMRLPFYEFAVICGKSFLRRNYGFEPVSLAKDL